MDHLSVSGRRRLMSRIGAKDTAPEMIVRRLVHRMGYRYRLHRRDLPGTPDLVFFGLRKVIFVHGCFWHQHDCGRGTRPSSNQGFWKRKLEANMRRDRANLSALEENGWSVLVVWECETKALGHLSQQIKRFLRP